MWRSVSAIDDKTSDWLNTKINYQVSRGHKIVGFQQYQRKDAIRNVTQFVPWESRQHAEYRVHTRKVEWQVAKGNKVASVLVGTWRSNKPDFGFVSNQVATIDQLTQQVTIAQRASATALFVGLLGLRDFARPRTLGLRRLVLLAAARDSDDHDPHDAVHTASCHA